MTSMTAPTPDPSPDPSAAGDLPRGVPPRPSAVPGLDWSGTPAEAAVGRLLHAAHAMDRDAVRLVEALAGVVESGATDDALGVAVELVLSQSARMVRFERTTVLRAATTLAVMPAVRQAAREGWISWSQVRAIVTAVGRVDVDGRCRVDDLVARLAASYADMEADALVHEVDWLVDSLLATREAQEPRRAIETNRLVATGRLDGSGTLYGEYDPDHFPLVMQRIDNHADDRHPFETADTPPATADDAAGMCDAALTAAHEQFWKVQGRNAGRRAAALFELVCGRDADTLTRLDAADTARTDRAAVLVTCDVSTLLDGTTPAWVLNRLGGRIKVTAETARRWIDTHGADVRLFLHDEIGEVVGYGRRRRLADGWLRDAIIARDIHDTFPCSTTPGVVCDVDHVQDWDRGGRTDVDNLTLLARRNHTDKTSGDWRLTRHPDGTRTWTATASGYRIHQPPPPHLRRIGDRRTPPDLGPSP